MVLPGARGGGAAGVAIVHHPPRPSIWWPGATEARRSASPTGARWSSTTSIVTSGHTANPRPARRVASARTLSPYPVGRYVEQLPTRRDGGGGGNGPGGRRCGDRAHASAGAVSSPRRATACATGPADGSRCSICSRAAVCRSPPSRSPAPIAAACTSRSICTPEALDALSGRSNGARRLVDVRAELLPLLFAEMYVRYYAQMAFRRGGGGRRGRALAPARPRGPRGASMQELAGLAARFGRSTPRRCSSATSPSYASQRGLRALRLQRRSPTICARPRCRTAPARSSRRPRCSGSSGTRCARWSSRAGCRSTPIWTSTPTSAAGSTASSRVRRRCARARCSR